MEEIRALIEDIWQAGSRLPAGPPRTAQGQAHLALSRLAGELTRIVWQCEHVLDQVEG